MNQPQHINEQHFNEQHCNDPTSGQVIALAGVLQSAWLVEQIAKQGSAAPESVNPSINSLFQFDAHSPAAVFGGIHGVHLGLRILHDILAGHDTIRYRDTMRYALSILYIQKKLSANADMLAVIRNRLDHTSLKYNHFTSNINDVADSIGAIYQDTISHFKYRIQITGSAQHLHNPVNASTIRALLLAGIRAAVLWRQTGGKRWHLFFSRKRLLKATINLLDF